MGAAQKNVPPSNKQCRPSLQSPTSGTGAILQLSQPRCPLKNTSRAHFFRLRHIPFDTTLVRDPYNQDGTEQGHIPHGCECDPQVLSTRSVTIAPLTVRPPSRIECNTGKKRDGHRMAKRQNSQGRG